MCIFKTPKFEAPKTPQPEDANAAGYRDAQRRAGMKGFASTIGPASVLGAAFKQTANPTPQKTLLGG